MARLYPYEIHGLSRETGEPKTLRLEAPDAADARRQAADAGVVVERLVMAEKAPYKASIRYDYETWRKQDSVRRSRWARAKIVANEEEALLTWGENFACFVCIAIGILGVLNGVWVELSNLNASPSRPPVSYPWVFPLGLFLIAAVIRNRATTRALRQDLDAPRK